MKLTKKLRRVGSSMGVIIDKPILEELGLKEGDFIEIDVRKAN